MATIERRAHDSLTLTTMYTPPQTPVTIAFTTLPDRRLDVRTARDAFHRAVAIMEDTARICGWEYVSRDRLPGSWVERSRDLTVNAEGEGMYLQHSWAVPGMGAVTLPWIEGTGIIPSTLVFTGRALNRLEVHTSIALALRRMNALAFDGRLVIDDDTGFASTLDVFSLAEPFSASIDELLALADTLAQRGWLTPDA